MTRISGLTAYLLNLDFFFFFFINFFSYRFFSFNPVSFFFCFLLFAFLPFFMPLTVDCTVQSTVKRPMSFVCFWCFSFLINFFRLFQFVNVNFFFLFSYQTFITRIPGLTWFEGLTRLIQIFFLFLHQLFSSFCFFSLRFLS